MLKITQTGAGVESTADVARNIEEEELMTHASTADATNATQMFFMEQNSDRANTLNGGTLGRSKK